MEQLKIPCETCGADLANEGQLLVCRKHYVERIAELEAKLKSEPVPGSQAAALYVFMGWLTVRKTESGPFGWSRNVGDVVDLICKFCEANNLKMPEAEQLEALRHPVEEPSDA